MSGCNPTKPKSNKGDTPLTSIFQSCPLIENSGCGKTREQYQKLAEGLLPASSGDSQIPVNVLNRNKAITKAYADLYNCNQGVFKWAGMAAFASCEVGKGMKEAQDAANSKIKKKAGEFVGVDPNKVEKALIRGNNAVFEDIYWQHLAYYGCGIEDLEKAYQENKITGDALEAWRLIDKGKKSGDQNLIWLGNSKLLHIEQSSVLQKEVYDIDQQLWKKVSELSWFREIDSPIPEDDVSFSKYINKGNIGDFQTRWKWINESMLPKWKELDKNPINVRDKLAPCLK